PSVATVFTGLYPESHGAGVAGKSPFNVDEGEVTRIADDVRTLAEWLSIAGYRCAGYVTNAYLDNGVERGFSSWTLKSQDGSDVAEYATGRLAAGGDQPLFLYLHLMETHDPILVADESF